MHTMLLKSCGSKMASNILNTCHISLQECQFSTTWKLFMIILLLMKRQIWALTSYHPVSSNICSLNVCWRTYDKKSVPKSGWQQCLSWAPVGFQTGKSSMDMVLVCKTIWIRLKGGDAADFIKNSLNPKVPHQWVEVGQSFIYVKWDWIISEGKTSHIFKITLCTATMLLEIKPCIRRSLPIDTHSDTYLHIHQSKKVILASIYPKEMPSVLAIKIVTSLIDKHL